MLPPIVAVTLVVQSRAGYGCHSVLSAPVPPSSPLSPHSSPRCPPSSNSMNTFLVCSEEHPSLMVCLLVCLALSLLPWSLLMESVGKGCFLLMGHWDDLREVQSPLPPRGTDFTAQKSKPIRVGLEQCRRFRGLWGPRTLISPGKVSHTSSQWPWLLSPDSDSDQIDYSKITSKILGQRSHGEVWIRYEPFLLPKHWREHPETLSMLVREQQEPRPWHLIWDLLHLHLGSLVGSESLE